MPGELFLQEFRGGVETTYATPVTPTRRLYFRPGAGFNRGGETRLHRFLTGTRDNQLEGTPAPQEPVGPFSLPVSSEEGNEILEMCLSAATISTPMGGTTSRQHEFKPGTLKSGTLQWYDGARPWQMAGVYVNTLKISGSANGENTMEGEFFASAITQTALTGAPTSRSPSFFEGWEARLYLDAYGGADNYGTTLIAAGQSVVNWNVELNNNLGRKFTAANTNAMLAAVVGELGVMGSVTFEASGAQSLTEYNNFVAATKRRMRLRFGGNDLIEGSINQEFIVDLPIVWKSMDLLAEDAGTRVYEGAFEYVYDPTPAFGIRIRTISTRTTNW